MEIQGEVFSRCFLTEEEFENAYKNSVFYVEKEYMKEYRKHIVGMQHVASMAKSYILNNWEKVTDWSGLEVKVKHGPTGEVTEYYNYVPYVPSPKKPGKMKSSKIWDEIQMSIDEDNKKRHNPITEFNEVVLDPTDGDFSITVNGGKEHWWIQDEAVIIIADYIEEKLKEK